jgi:hypothetical protein
MWIDVEGHNKITANELGEMQNVWNDRMGRLLWMINDEGCRCSNQVFTCRD